MDWKRDLYVLITLFLWVYRHFRWIKVTFRVSSSKEIYLLRMMTRIMSLWLSFWSAKIGMSCCMLLIIRMSILLIYYFSPREWTEELAFLSLVIGWLPPISEASILMFSSLETTLSFLMKVELEWALRFLGTGQIACEMACSPNSPVIFFQLGTVHEVRCPIFWNFWLLLWLLLFLLACVVLAMGCCTLLWCCFFPSFFRAESMSWSADGPSVLILRSAKRSGVQVLRAMVLILLFFFLPSLLHLC